MTHSAATTAMLSTSAFRQLQERRLSAPEAQQHCPYSASLLSVVRSSSLHAKHPATTYQYSSEYNNTLESKHVFTLSSPSPAASTFHSTLSPPSHPPASPFVLSGSIQSPPAGPWQPLAASSEKADVMWE
ncbi:hypothetical protein L202_02030 [Cryptococcus amylolentus CBS 6039]|uniref:Uncharacterized protein n=1 Tax=Cryptococcus amylolentus CBS 6039 TaxID=1295533 RepID=A0A1E3HZ59_9TREE|nr:hypothetical protein L202_02030 [Cryptococcus amylolentus CBS 6039]ODN81624.1 hypothetical protein L202_02030 [Cryptococcus amylolentus CBS 6039]